MVRTGRGLTWTLTAPNLKLLRSKVDRTSALLNLAGRILQRKNSQLARFVLVPLLARALRLLVSHLKSSNLDNLSHPQLLGLNFLLLAMYWDLERMLAVAIGRQNPWFSKDSKLYLEIATNLDELGDIVEAYSIPLNPKFRTLIDSASRQLPA